MGAIYTSILWRDRFNHQFLKEFKAVRFSGSYSFLGAVKWLWRTFLNPLQNNARLKKNSGLAEPDDRGKSIFQNGYGYRGCCGNWNRRSLSSTLGEI
jgi:hypothetical protein